MLKVLTDKGSKLGPLNHYFISIPVCVAISFQDGRSSPAVDLNFIVHLQIEAGSVSVSKNTDPILVAINKRINTNINEGN